jgi:hypothetical protein
MNVGGVRKDIMKPVAKARAVKTPKEEEPRFHYWKKVNRALIEGVSVKMYPIESHNWFKTFPFRSLLLLSSNVKENSMTYRAVYFIGLDKDTGFVHYSTVDPWSGPAIRGSGKFPNKSAYESSINILNIMLDDSYFVAIPKWEKPGK